MAHANENVGWWGRLNGYQKFVFIVATLAWMFDCLDQQIFNLARPLAMKSFFADAASQKLYGSYSVSIFLIGWAIGGMIFGSLGDKYGRAKMLGLTVMIYSIATGLSALSKSYFDFAAYRFLTGLGVGGVFGLAVALVADTVPNEVRPRALGVLQTFSTVGNCMAGLIGISLATYWTDAKDPWKWLFLVGAAPALLTAFTQLKLKEPQKWIDSKKKSDAEGKKAGSYMEVLGDGRWRKNAILGMILSCAGVVGLWGIGVFSAELTGDIAKLEGKSAPLWSSINLLVFNIGGFLGMLTFTRMSQHWPRKKSFLIFFLGALVTTVLVFQFLRHTHQIFWMSPIMGFFQLSVFAGFSIYLPELFPTRLRSTGTSFCYNVGRIVAASSPFTLGILAAKLTIAAGADPLKKLDAFGNAASMMCVIFLLGIVVLPFLPETKGQPLPED